YHNEIASQWGSRAATASLIDILAITTRGDVRSDVLKELERHLATLNEFSSKAGVDLERLRTLINNLQRLRGELMNAGSAFLQPLRDSEFLSAIK
ncbi:cell division protein ZapD, partial [Streptomyces scabiei]|uniref:cell division protein ZapD n=1 Tax=Streptomyces scabiei TaxID=1930 RepID=UPI0038F6B6ED